MVGESYYRSLPPYINPHGLVPRMRPCAGLRTRWVGSVRDSGLHETTPTAGHLYTPAYVNRIHPLETHS